MLNGIADSKTALQVAACRFSTMLWVVFDPFVRMWLLLLQ